MIHYYKTSIHGHTRVRTVWNFQCARVTANVVVFLKQVHIVFTPEKPRSC